MSDENDPSLHLDGLHVGDFVMRPVPATGTDGHLDLPETRERDQRAEDEARAARAAGEVAPSHPLRDPTLPAPTQVIPLGEGGDVDASIEDARERAGDATPMPILLRDPLTGKVAGSM
jgi:hypothetical protein